MEKQENQVQVNWKTIKTELQNKLNKVKTEKQMKSFVEDIFGGFLYANQDEIKKSFAKEGEMALKPHVCEEKTYIG